METTKFEVRHLLKDKRLWFASVLITWAAALQGHMMWMQRQESFKHKFGDVNQQVGSEEAAENPYQWSYMFAGLIVTICLCYCRAETKAFSIK